MCTMYLKMKSRNIHPFKKKDNEERAAVPHAIFSSDTSTKIEHFIGC